MKRLPNIREIYRGVRKQVARPTRVESDKRAKIRKKEDENEISGHVGRSRIRGPDREE